ncbi:MAG: PKD domain-containing protein [Planctomycetota bacterium]|nr:PKD domain-containing protein [Planctomycetota bacterium]
MRSGSSRCKLWTIAVLLLAGMCGAGRLQGGEPPTVGEIQFSPTDTPYTTDTVTMSVTASSSLPLTYTWDFGDTTTAKTTTGSVTHVYATAGADLYIVYVDVSDGVNAPVSDNQWVEVIDPPAATDAYGINKDDPPVTNPDNRLAVSVLADQGGVIQFGIDDSGVRERAGRSLLTDWGDAAVSPDSRTSTFFQPRHQYNAKGIYIATVTSKDATPGASVPEAKVRKTVVMSAEEVGAPATVKAPPPLDKRHVIVSKLQGKVNFADLSKTDMVNLSFLFELPEGLDRMASHDFTISAGNVVETVTVDPKGKGVGTLYRKVKVKFQRLEKGVTLTPAGLTATVTVQIASADLTTAGFDTEGITVVPKSTNPKIQVAMLVEGVGYTQQAEVELKVSTKGDKGTFKLPSR